jgi:perosamine synthetase
MVFTCRKSGKVRCGCLQQVRVKNSQADGLANLINEAIRTVAGPKYLPLHEPEFTGNEMFYIQDCLKSTQVSGNGPYVKKLESAISDFTKSKFTVTTSNGTSALHIGLLLAGVLPGEEVLVPAATFAATANAIIYCGAVPHFIDSNLSTLGINVEKLEDYLEASTELKDGVSVNKKTGRVIRAIVPVHIFGHASDMPELLELATKFQLEIVEDAAESLGSFYGDKHTGTFSGIGCLSFNGNKIITTGGGGAILVSSEELATRARHLVHTARINGVLPYTHDQVGYNYRMPDINAAIGLAQMEKLPSKIQKKRLLAKRYQSAFKEIVQVELFTEPPKRMSNYWLQTLILKEPSEGLIRGLTEKLNNLGIMVRPLWRPLHLLNHFNLNPRMDLSGSIQISKQVLNIPSSPQLVDGKP